MSKTYQIETSLTLSYRELTWGLERIVLDSVSNHLPADSKGTVTSVKLKQGGKYVDLEEADPEKQTDEVMIEDNGSGYDAGLLSVLFSSKQSEAISVGQFGEGLKMVSAAALRNNLAVEYRSRNWIARPYAKPEVIDGYALKRLCFEVTENGDHLEGSRTVFLNPSKVLVEEIFRIPEKVLHFNDTFKILYTEKPFFMSKAAPLYLSRVVDSAGERNVLFIKGIRVQDLNSIFSYDLGLDNINPDRIFADRDKVYETIKNLLANCTNEEVIGKVLTTAHEHPDAAYAEFSAFYDKERFEGKNRYDSELEYLKKKIFNKDSLYPKLFEDFKKGYGYSNIWTETFKQLFGENAVLASHDTNVNQDAVHMGYTPVKLNSNIHLYLKDLGVQDADSLSKEQEYRWIDLEDLTENEQAVYNLKDELSMIVFDQACTIEVKVYTGLFTKSGREIETSGGVTIKEQDCNMYIGVKRSTLANPEKFGTSFLHELGHAITNLTDYDRKYAEIYQRTTAKLALEVIKLRKQSH